MKIIKKKSKSNSIILELKMDQSDYKELVDSRLVDYRKKVNMPGFRIGKVPMGLIKKKYEIPIRVEEINKIISSQLQEYISKNKISIIGGPIPIDQKIDFENEVNYVFGYELGLQPEIDLSKVEKSTIDYWLINPETKQIQEYVENLQKRFGQIKNVDKIKEGDMLNVNLTEIDNKMPKENGIKNTTSFLIDKINNDSIKKKLLKLKKSESINFQVNKAFTNIADLSSMLNVSKEEAEKIDSEFSCEIINISRLMPSELNAEFFKKAYPKKNLKSEKEFNRVIKEELSTMYLKDSDRKLFNDASLLFMEKVKVDISDSFLRKWLKSNLKKELSESEFDKEYINYVKYLSWQLIENKICADNNIKITDEKLKNFTKKYVLQQMKSYGSMNMGDKEIDGIVANVLKNKQESEKMTNELIMIELVDYFKSKMKIKRNSISLDEFIKLANNQK